MERLWSLAGRNRRQSVANADARTPRPLDSLWPLPHPRDAHAARQPTARWRAHGRGREDRGEGLRCRPRHLPAARRFQRTARWLCRSRTTRISSYRSKSPRASSANGQQTFESISNNAESNRSRQPRVARFEYHRCQVRRKPRDRCLACPGGFESLAHREPLHKPRGRCVCWPSRRKRPPPLLHPAQQRTAETRSEPGTPVTRRPAETTAVERRWQVRCSKRQWSI